MLYVRNSCGCRDLLMGMSEDPFCSTCAVFSGASVFARFELREMVAQNKNNISTYTPITHNHNFWPYISSVGDKLPMLPTKTSRSSHHGIRDHGLPSTRRDLSGNLPLDESSLTIPRQRHQEREQGPRFDSFRFVFAVCVSDF